MLIRNLFYCENEGLRRKIHQLYTTGTQGDHLMPKRIYVGNLPRTITKRELTKVFNKYGTVESVTLTSGSAVVVMTSGGDTAITSLHQKDMGGRTISVTDRK